MNRTLAVLLITLTVPVTLTLVGSVTAQATEDIDFGAPPPKGLLFSRLRKTVSSLSGRRVVGAAGERSVQILRQTLTYDEDYTEKIVRVKGNRVTALTRKYVTAATRSEVETDRMPRPRFDQREEPYAAVDLAVEWKDGKAELQVIVPPDERTEGDDPDGLARPSEAMARALAHAFDHPHPLLPRGPTRRAVGSCWTVGEEAINRIFPCQPAARIKGALEVRFVSIRADHPIRVSTVTVTTTGVGQATKVEKSEKVPFRCAVLAVKGTITTTPKGGLPLELTLEGTLLYSIEHRLVVAQKLTGRQKIAGTLQGDRFEFEGPYEDTAAVELHREKPAPAGGPEPQKPAKTGERG